MAGGGEEGGYDYYVEDNNHNMRNIISLFAPLNKLPIQKENSTELNLLVKAVIFLVRGHRGVELLIEP